MTKTRATDGKSHAIISTCDKATRNYRGTWYGCGSWINSGLPRIKWPLEKWSRALTIKNKQCMPITVFFAVLILKLIQASLKSFSICLFVMLFKNLSKSSICYISYWLASNFLIPPCTVYNVHACTRNDLCSQKYDNIASRYTITTLFITKNAMYWVGPTLYQITNV